MPMPSGKAFCSGHSKAQKFDFSDCQDEKVSLKFVQCSATGRTDGTLAGKSIWRITAKLYYTRYNIKQVLIARHHISYSSG
jgi:hypothetical protein